MVKLLVLVFIYQIHCDVCRMRSMKTRPVCARNQPQDHRVVMDPNQSNQSVSDDPALVAEVLDASMNIGTADVMGIDWGGLVNDNVTVVGNVSITKVEQDVWPDYREGGSEEQQDLSNYTFGSSTPDRENVTNVVNGTRRERVCSVCPQLPWEGAGISIIIAVCVGVTLCGITCITYDIVEWCQGTAGKPGDETHLCYHCRRAWWVCTVPRSKQRQWRVTQDRRWREQSVRQMKPGPPLGESGVCDNNGFQQIELTAM